MGGGGVRTASARPPLMMTSICILMACLTCFGFIVRTHRQETTTKYVQPELFY